MLGTRVIVSIFVFVSFYVGNVAAQTNGQDYAALTAFTKGWGNLPMNWKGADPCGSGWDGITCNSSRITSITLSSLGLTGQLNGDLVSLTELEILDLSYNNEMTGSLPRNIGELSKLTSLQLLGCGFSGTIPDSVGSLKELVYLSLNSNKFTGGVPASIGKLANLYWLDLSDNNLSGTIPVSIGTTPGLDSLVNTKHFHFGMNQLSGTIPSSLFNADMKVIHVLFDNNKFTGSLPSTVGLLQDLQAVRFDRNSLSGPLPTNLNNLTQVNELMLSNNKFSGPVPDLTGMSNLNYVDMSNNSFDATVVPNWLSTLQSLTTIMMEGTTLFGVLPAALFSLPQLETVVLKSNQINGTLDISSSYSSQLQLIDLQNNKIGAFTVTQGFNVTLMLAGNPYCDGNQVDSLYCIDQQQPGASFSTPVYCASPKCASGQTSSPSCKCAYPYTGALIFRAPAFAVSGTSHLITLQQSLLNSFVNMTLPVESVSLSNVNVDKFGYLNMLLSVFPRGQDYFNATGIIKLGYVLSNQTYKPPKEFGPYVFIANSYTNFQGKSKSSQKGIIVGAAVGVSILFLLLLCAGGYAYHLKKRAQKAKQKTNPFVSWDTLGAGGDVPQLKGARFFTFDELQKCTNNFSETSIIGSGGFGKVYKGVLADGQVVAIKRSQQGSMQGSREFKNEIELLSRVHHKNLVKLLGFCFVQAEHILVYEFVSNGTLQDSLLGKSGVQMDWIRRLMVTLGSARGLQYLHELADPTIIHRDIKSNNILLDDQLNAKVADFGLSKPFGEDEKSYVSTQVKGTMGYLDPEYYMTNQLTEKSDVFSFGVVMLELVTARRPIQDGKYIVREVKTAIDRTKDLYDLYKVMDPVLLAFTTLLVGFEQYVDLAIKCADESAATRPTMGEVVKEIEGIIKLAGMNPSSEAGSNSQSYEATSGGNFRHPYNDDSLFQYSGVQLSSMS